ncbi:MAG: CTP-dependent riboflavin kinase [Rhodospirillaceae bacterium]|jgi:CTP-dependent riboflavin kinase|nr:CTP-dependent riboflavin kinase [Rhodospirillaceae bacterium]MBT3886754.1 CTP-dependent riboflavin kinase [Rhodospirillaceae bacterium]MBT4116457.1 CTP-dependent riboflavin kinase [Rhodospirillaceae bacterium]MBT4717896.1 CTP-dependent riboflavin kinase [Rhodospirillaceae bacterium]MBT4751623.1 CTP-dependent riboflavin kinase [Rhodospirillaceae bacterium]
MQLTGKLVTGAKQASLFTQLDWVMKQCAEKLGFEPYPGTLNLEIVADDLGLLLQLKHQKGVELLPPDPNFCIATVLPIHIGDYEGAVVVPAEEVSIHNENIIEIISGEKLRGALNIEDGDLVTIRFEKSLVA